MERRTSGKFSIHLSLFLSYPRLRRHQFRIVLCMSCQTGKSVASLLPMLLPLLLLLPSPPAPLLLTPGSAFVYLAC